MIYKNEYLNEISFPLGGIGSGSIGLCGNGRLMDWEIFNRPAKGSINNYASFVVRATDKNGKNYTKVLMGDITKDLTGQRDVIALFRGFGFGPTRFSMCGFPHFKNCVFKGEFPMAEIHFSDDNFPGTVVLRAFNPLIPGKSDDSSIPAAFFEISYENETDEEMEFSVSFTVSNPFGESKNIAGKDGSISYIKLTNPNVSADDKAYGDMTIATDSVDIVAQEYWYRGGWCDGASVYWREVSENTRLRERSYEEPGKDDPCSLASYADVGAKETKSFRYILSWNVPNCYNYWSDDETDRDHPWKNYYAKLFADSVASATYSLKEWDRLYGETDAFRDAMFNTTLDSAVVDAASATLSVIKTATVLRLENGEFYGWEGMHETAGSCEGTCQHVWNYAYALCFLFPDLERSIRDLEFDYSTDADGGMQFRLKLPLTAKPHTHIPCLDGQMGAVIKTYREWKISGDDAWLKRHFDKVMQVLEYAWSDKNICEWDKNKDGVLEGRQHHTLDMELFGPSSWLQGFYLAALKAGAEMAEYLGYSDKAAEYMEVFEKGKKYTKEHLFNGKYFIQEVDLKDKEKLEHFGVADTYWNSEIDEMKYQIAQGSEIDQLCGQWHANILGLGELFDKEQVKTALSTMYELNFAKSMRDIANAWRIFALNDESGAMICAYPEGVYKPIIPIPYCEEAMHGFEYQLAGLMISEGMIKEGLEIVHSVRDRYNGANRNPWNEIECGSNYARSMASFALIPIFAGFTFDVPHKTIGFNPIEEGDFRSIWSLGCGWGTYRKEENRTVISVKGGALSANKISLPYIKEVTGVTVDGKTVVYTFDNGVLMLDTDHIAEELIVKHVMW
ncbi:MAG: hypothetical protein IJC78_04285 [Clostridia bacterium]|nr:hypothetical protein [Clostridia bacterium]